MISTTDSDQAAKDVALLSEKAAMRHHTAGGWRMVNKLWSLAENFNCGMIPFYDQLACKGMNGVQGLMEEESRKRPFHFMRFEHDLQDPRTISRRQMREQVN